jgi:hypothetical protein
LAHRANSIAAAKRSIAITSSLRGGRGFSELTVKALMDGGVDAPERLLFLDDAATKECLSIGKVSFEAGRS